MLGEKRSYLLLLLHDAQLLQTLLLFDLFEHWHGVRVAGTAALRADLATPLLTGVKSPAGANTATVCQRRIGLLDRYFLIVNHIVPDRFTRAIILRSLGNP